MLMCVLFQQVLLICTFHSSLLMSSSPTFKGSNFKEMTSSPWEVLPLMFLETQVDSARRLPPCIYMPVFYWQSINFNERFLKYLITYEFMKKICFKNIKSLSFRGNNCYNLYVSSIISLFLNMQTPTTFNWDHMLRFIAWRRMVIKFNHNSFFCKGCQKTHLKQSILSCFMDTC